MSKIIVTITPPTPNGNLHLGHIAGPFLAADIFTRIHRLKGHEVVFLCYSDDYQSYVARKARELGRERFELATCYAAEIEKTLYQADIGLDWFLKSWQNPCFEEAVTLLYTQARKKGAIIQKEELVPYSEEDDVYGYEAFGRGTCNYCGHISDASQCENCAQAPDLHEMGAIISVISKKPMTWISRRREFLDLGSYTQSLKDYYADVPLRGYLREYLEFTLSRKDLLWPIDRPGEFGIDIDVDGIHTTIHTWFCGIAGYMAAFKEFAETIKKPGMFHDFWYDRSTKLVHFLGFDCSFSHGIVYPSLLSNVDGLTTNVYLYANRFLKLEGNDFSTSRGIAIWVNDILTEAPLAAVRFYLALHSPEENTSNFERAHFESWVNHVFLPGVGIIKAIVKPGAWSLDAGGLEEADRQMAADVITRWNHYSGMEHFSILEIAKALNDLILYIGQVPHDREIAIQLLGQLYLCLALPIHPDLSGEILKEKAIDADDIMQQVLSGYVTAVQ